MSEPVYEDDGVPFYGADPFGDPYGTSNPYGDADFADGSGEDISAIAREARMMAEMMGEPLDTGFETALRHIEQGADPDDVFGELDAAEASTEPDPPSDVE